MVEFVQQLCAFLAFVKIISASPSILIIGGGAAGIAAATRLLENNLTNIRILEAESRIGGRIKSIKLGHSYVDLGARWCHGEKGNVVYHMAKDLNLFDSTQNPETFYLSSRQAVEEMFGKDILNIIYEIYDSTPTDSKDQYQTVGEVFQQRFRKEIHWMYFLYVLSVIEIFHNSAAASTSNILDKYKGSILTSLLIEALYVLLWYNRIIHEKYGNSSKKLKIAANAIDLLRSYVLSGEGAFSWFDPSWISDFKSSEGDFHLNWKGKGYKIILDVMMKKYPDPRQSLPIDDKFIFNKEVTQISWNAGSDGQKIDIRCTDYSTYTADHIIFTPSVGVLKEKADKLFLPKLPAEKLRAINEIGFGAVMKVIMYFSEAWWEDSPGFLFVWTEEDKILVGYEFPEGPTWQGKSWLTSINMIIRADYNANVLTVWFTGHLVPAIELLPEELLIRGILFTFNKFLGNLYNIRRPDKILRSDWYANPHFRGTYSFQTVRSRITNRRTSAQEYLAAPLKDFRGRPIVLFAGEATHSYHYSTVHGAIESGYREADALIELYN